jgi:hypothetical protein
VLSHRSASAALLNAPVLAGQLAAFVEGLFFKRLKVTLGRGREFVGTGT